MKTIAIFYNNGGVGRTTSTINIGACLAGEKKKKTYIVDLDNAAFLTEALNIEGGEYIADIIKEKRKLRKEDFGSTSTPNLFVLKNRRNEISDKLFQSFAEDGQVADNTLILKEIFSELDGDFLIFDCPQYYELPTLNVLRFADYLLCPLEVSPKGLNTLESMLHVHEQTVRVNPDLKMLGFFGTKVEMGLRRFKQTIPILKNELGDLFFNATISKNENIVTSQSRPVRQTIFEFGDVKAIQEFINLTNEILLKTQ